jgi:hypothetical protein
MRRREFITLLAAGWPIGAGAQQPAMPMVGLFRTTSPDDQAVLIASSMTSVIKNAVSLNQGGLHQ